MRLKRKVRLLGAPGAGKSSLVRKPRSLGYLLEAQTKGRGFIGSRPAVLIANKVDLTGDFALTKAQVDAASKLNWQLLRASAKSGDHVDDAFVKLAELMLESRKASA